MPYGNEKTKMNGNDYEIGYARNIMCIMYACIGAAKPIENIKIVHLNIKIHICVHAWPDKVNFMCM